MGEVVEVGKENTNQRIGDRVVVPFTIACGRCFFCKRQMWSLCDNSNPNAWMAEKVYGDTTSGLFDPSFVITHRLPLDAAPEAYKMFCALQSPR